MRVKLIGFSIAPCFCQIRADELKLLSAVCDRQASGAVVSYGTLGSPWADYEVV